MGGEEKKKVRKLKTEQRDKMTAEERNAADKRILEKVLSLPEYRWAKAVLTYVSMRSEADTKRLISEALKEGKTVAAPRVSGKEMQFYVIASQEELEEGYFGILEPGAACPLFSFSDVSPEEIFLLIPGTAFDRTGGRIGYGGGFYDRFLSEHLELKRIALAYEAQMMERVPREEYDLCMDKIVTETEITAFCKRT